MTESKGEKAKCQSGKKEKTKTDHRERAKWGVLSSEEGERRERESIIDKSS